MDIEAFKRCIRGYRPRLNPAAVRAAVNIIAREGGGGVEVLMIKRVENPRDPWSGDVAFPGGKVEEGDSDFIDTALRETWEEVGIPRDELEILGFLDEVYPRRAPEFRVAPVVSTLKRGDVEVRIGEEAVRAFWVDISKLGSEVEVESPRGGGLVRAYLYGGEVIWGMTKRIIENLFRVLSECGGGYR